MKWYELMLYGSCLAQLFLLAYEVNVLEPKRRKNEEYAYLLGIAFAVCDEHMPNTPAEREQATKAIRLFLSKEYASLNLPYGETHDNFESFIASDTALSLVEGVVHLSSWEEFIREMLNEPRLKEEEPK